jgi:hypothetical protein
MESRKPDKLPEFEGWTVDERLGQFRKVTWQDGKPSMKTRFIDCPDGKLIRDRWEASKEPIKQLRCCSCGEITFGRQWWNRDTGFGLCHACADRIGNKEKPSAMFAYYGFEGIHYKLEVIVKVGE